MSSRYASPKAFKQALDARVRSAAEERDIPITRQRQLLVFDRYLARLYDECGDALVLKGALSPCRPASRRIAAPETWTPLPLVNPRASSPASKPRVAWTSATT